MQCLLPTNGCDQARTQHANDMWHHATTAAPPPTMTVSFIFSSRARSSWRSSTRSV